MSWTPTPWLLRLNPMRADGVFIGAEPYIEEVNRLSGVEQLTYFRKDITNAQVSPENGARIVACVNFFHGHPIPTENIPEGGFWEMVEEITNLAVSLNSTRFIMENKESRALAGEIVADARALLAKLGIEGG